MTAVRIGIVGTGRIAARMAAAMRVCAEVVPTAVCSTDGERARSFAERHDIPGSCSEVTQLLQLADVDAVYVASATSMHADHVRAALRGGKPVLCEKPFATNYEDAAAIISLARQSDTLFMEGLWTSLLPSWRRAAEIASSGSIGELKQLHADFGYPEDAQTLARLASPQGGGVLLDRAVYPISLAVTLLGPAEEATSIQTFTEAGVEVFTAIQLRHRGGAASQLSASMVSYGANRASISGSMGRIDLIEPLLGAERVQWHRWRAAAEPSADGGNPVSPRQQLKQLPILRRIRNSLQSATGEFHSYGRDQYASMWSHFAGLVRSGAKESPVVTHGHSLEVARIVSLIRGARGPDTR